MSASDLGTRPGVKSSSRVPALVSVVLASQALVLLGVLADVSSITGSGWFRQALSADLLRWISFALSIFLTVVLVYVFAVTRRRERSLLTELAVSRENAVALTAREVGLSKRNVRILRSLTLDQGPSPGLRDVLEPMLTELALRLPDNGGRYKLCVVRPNVDGTFSVLAERGMDPSSVNVIERKGNWTTKTSFFANMMHLDREEELPYRLFKTGDTNYLDLQLPKGAGKRPTSSKTHFIVAIRDPANYAACPSSTLALVSVGIPAADELIDLDTEQAFFDRVSPVVRMIEAVLLVYSDGLRDWT